MSATARFVFRSAFVLLAAGFLALLGIVGMTYWLGERTQVNFEDALRARDLRGAAVDLRAALQSAESSQRGFMLTGNQIYLAPFSTAKALAQRQLDAVKQLSGPGADPSPALARLSTVVAEKFDEMDRTVALVRDRRGDEALSVVKTNQGKALMDEANVFLSGIIRTADERLTSGIAEQRDNSTLLRWMTVAGGLLIALVVGTVVTLLARYTRDVTAARDEVAALNSGLERRVHERTSDLAQANSEIQRFAYVVTHDLRAPLVNIMGFTSELETGIGHLQALIDKSAPAVDAADPVTRRARAAATEDLPEAIGFIRSSTQKMDGLINAILKLSRDGARKIRPEKVLLRDVMEASLATIRHQVSEAGGHVDLAIDVPPILSDRTALEQVFGNLLENAVKYRSKGRPLQIKVSARMVPGNGVQVSVADNGRGIAESDLERVFDLFRRSGTQDQPGEGIGLAHVRALVRNLGGRVSVSSVLGVGTTFQVVLPLSLALEGVAA